MHHPPLIGQGGAFLSPPPRPCLGASSTTQPRLARCPLRPILRGRASEPSLPCPSHIPIFSELCVIKQNKNGAIFNFHFLPAHPVVVWHTSLVHACAGLPVPPDGLSPYRYPVPHPGAARQQLSFLIRHHHHLSVRLRAHPRAHRFRHGFCRQYHHHYRSHHPSHRQPVHQ